MQDNSKSFEQILVNFLERLSMIKKKKLIEFLAAIQILLWFRIV